MPAASIEKDITNRMERWVGQASGTSRQESRSIVGASIVRNYFRSGVDPNGALTQVNSLALAAIPNLPPGTLPPVVLPFDPTSTTPVCIVAVDSPDGSQNESILYDVGRYEVRNMLMSINGAIAPVVYGGKIRAVMAYLDRQKLRGPRALAARRDERDGQLQRVPADRRRQDRRHRLRARLELDVRLPVGDGRHPAPHRRSATSRTCATWRRPRTPSFIQTNVVRINGRREVYIPVFRQLGSSTLARRQQRPATTSRSSPTG